MTENQGQLALRRLCEEALAGGRLDVADAILGPGARVHLPPLGDGEGSAPFKKWARSWRKGIPDLRVTMDAEYAENGHVAARFTCVGTNTSSLFGFRPTKAPLTVAGMGIGQVVGTQIGFLWLEVDLLGVLQQLGVVPAGQ
jgi:predicted ester cyclase